MKTAFSQNRIERTFSGYLIIILIPLGVLMYQGTSALKNHRRQIENTIDSQLRSLGNEFVRHLSDEWQNFLTRERVREYLLYQPLVLPDKDSIRSEGEAVQRSTLYSYVNNLAKLYHENNTINNNTGQPAVLSPSLDQIIKKSLVGYFQFDPSDRTFITPYDETAVFQTGPREARMIAQYRNFLDEVLKPELVVQLDIVNRRNVTPRDIWFHLKAHRLNKVVEPIDRINQVRKRLNKPVLVSDSNVVEISYYDFSFFNFESENDRFVVGLRTVVMDNHVVVQGFVFNTLSMITEAQSYLELIQPEVGSLVVEEFTPNDSVALFYPFSLLSVAFKRGGDQKYLQNYRAEERRFWIIMVCLTIALGVSSLHLGKLIFANQRLHRKKNDFISSITHELKAPLTSIIMYTEMLEEGWAKGKEPTYYRYIHCEADRLSRLIKNILDFSGLERGIFKFKKSSLLLHTFIEDTLEPLHVWMENGGMKVELKIDATPFVKIDKDSLAQVIYNLCDNAIKYATSADTPVLTIIVTETKTHARLLIYDNGPGIPKSDEPKIFQRFYRVENELTRESTGTGLGLALVKELVEGNDGIISIYHPASGRGFGVKIDIPKVMVDVDLVSRN